MGVKQKFNLKRVYNGRITTVKHCRADISSVNPSSERIEELSVLLVFRRVSRSFAIGANIYDEI